MMHLLKSSGRSTNKNRKQPMLQNRNRLLPLQLFNDSKNNFMGVRRSRARRKPPPERQRPFFDKQNSEQPTFFSANSIQRKLNVSKANDPAEKEADSAAKNVMQVQK